MKSRFPTICCTALLAVALALPGCASRYGSPMTKVNYYPQCYRPVQQLREDENTVARSTAAGAITGGLLGAIVGGLASGDVKGAVAGAAVGATAGGVAGNIYGKKQQRTHDQQLLAEYNRQLGAASAAMDRQPAAANVAIHCYKQAFDRLVADYKAGRITKEELKDHYAEIRSGLQETSYVLNQRYDSMVKKDAEYQRVLDTEYKEATPEQAGPVTVQTPPQVQTRRTASNWKRSVRNVKQTHDKAVKQSENNDATIASLVDQAARV